MGTQAVPRSRFLGAGHATTRSFRSSKKLKKKIPATPPRDPPSGTVAPRCSLHRKPPTEQISCRLFAPCSHSLTPLPLLWAAVVTRHRVPLATAPCNVVAPRVIPAPCATAAGTHHRQAPWRRAATLRAAVARARATVEPRGHEPLQPMRVTAAGTAAPCITIEPLSPRAASAPPSNLAPTPPLLYGPARRRACGPAPPCARPRTAVAPTSSHRCRSQRERESEREMRKR